MLVMYSNNTETLVCEKKDEKKLLKEYFKKGVRDVGDYNKLESGYALEITCNMTSYVAVPCTGK